MKKNAFTLTELIGIIALISILIIVSVPLINSLIKSYQTKTYENQVLLLEKEAQNWGTDNMELLPETTNENIFLELGDLVSGGYIKNNKIIDPRDNEPLDGCILVSFNPNYNNYEFKYHDMSCTKLANEYKPLFTPEIVDIAVEINSTVTYPTVIATSSSGQVLNVTGPEIRKNGILTSDVLTTNLGDKYNLIYSAYDSNKGYTYNKIYIMTIVDTTSPIISFYEESGVKSEDNDYYINIQKDSVFAIPSAVVEDNSGQVITPEVLGSVNTKVAGKYEITYVATDRSGNEAALVLTVNVLD